MLATMEVGSKTPPLREEGWWWGWKTPTSCFDAREVGKIENSPPCVKTQDGRLVMRLRSLLCPTGSDWNRLKPDGFRLEIFNHSIGQTVENFSNFSNRIPIGTSGLLKCPLFYAGEGSGSLIKMKCHRKLWS